MKKGVLLLLAGLVLVGCGGPGAGEAVDNARDVLAVSILPQKFFLQKIVGDRYDIHVMIPPGYSPATFAPTPRQVRELGRAKLYFRIGHIGFEAAWMKKIAELHPHLVIVDTSVGIPLIRTEHAHHHGGDAEHHEQQGGVDPHIWLSPAAVKTQAAAMLSAVSELEPTSQKLFMENYNRFVQEIDQLDVDIRTILRSIDNRKLLVFHPAWSYFARDFSLEQHPIELDGKEPNPSGLKEVIRWAKAEGVRVIFVQRQFDTDSAKAIADELGGVVVAMDPLAEDWLANMRAIALTLREHLGGSVKE